MKTSVAVCSSQLNKTWLTGAFSFCRQLKFCLKIFVMVWQPHLKVLKACFQARARPSSFRNFQEISQVMLRVAMCEVKFIAAVPLQFVAKQAHTTRHTKLKLPSVKGTHSLAQTLSLAFRFFLSHTQWCYCQTVIRSSFWSTQKYIFEQLGAVAELSCSTLVQQNWYFGSLEQFCCSSWFAHQTANFEIHN